MKVLLFEYISGGGLAQHALPASLAREGRLMLEALLADFAAVPAVQATVLLDWRLARDIATAGAKLIAIGPEQDYQQAFSALLQDCDAAWPIAPESGGLLARLCQSVEDSGKLLLTSPADAVALTGDKYLTYQRFRQYQIATVPTRLLADAAPQAGEWMVKAIDGVGCEDSRVVADLSGFLQTVEQPGRYLVQPHLAGRKTSLSGLFKHGRAWLLSVNLQQFELASGRYHLTGIVVSWQADDGSYQRLLETIAAAFPSLWGYAGVDLLETEHGRLVLEINPRLTTSYAGLNQALGVNVAELVLQLTRNEPNIRSNRNQPVHITL